MKGHVEQLSNQGGAALVSQYNGLSADHIEYLDDAGVQAMAQSGTVAVLLPGAFYFCRSASVRRLISPKTWCADGRRHRLQPRHQPVCQPAPGDEYGLRPVWPDARRGLGWRHAACGAGAGRGATHGQLQSGFVADFIVWDAHHPVEMVYEPGRNPLYQRIFRGRQYEVMAARRRNGLAGARRQRRSQQCNAHFPDDTTAGAVHAAFIRHRADKL